MMMKAFYFAVGALVVALEIAAKLVATVAILAAMAVVYPMVLVGALFERMDRQ